MTCLGRGDGTPLTLGHTYLPEMDWHLITRESPDFSHGECQEIVACIHPDNIASKNFFQNLDLYVKVIIKKLIVKYLF